MQVKSVLATKNNYCLRDSKPYFKPQYDSFEKSQTFTGGLNKTMQEGVVEKKLIKSKKKSQLGQLPPSWFEKIPRETLAKVAPQIFADFSKIGEYLRTTKDTTGASNLLTNTLKINGILEPDKKSNLVFIGEGNCGRAYKFDVNNESFVIKVFHKLHDYDDLHGNRIEQNVAMYIRKNSKENNNFVPVYFSDLTHGFIVSKFLDRNNVPRAENILNLDKLGLKSLDICEKNLVGNITVDYGGMLPNVVAKNKAARSVYNRLINSPDKEEFFIKELSNPDTTPERLAGLACGIKFLPVEKRLEYLNRLEEENSPIISEAVIQNYYYFTVDKQQEMFKQYSKTDNSELTKTLCHHLHILPEEERTEWYETHINMHSNNLQVAFANSLYLLPEEDQVKWFKKLNNQPSMYLKHVLETVLDDLEPDTVKKIKNLT